MTSPDSEKDQDRYDRIATVVLGVLLIGGALTFLLWPWIQWLSLTARPTF